MLLFWDRQINWWLLVALGVAVGVPAALAAYWLRTCSAWRTTEDKRCRQPRAGFMHRCAAHAGFKPTAYDLCGVLAASLAVVNLAAFAYVITF